MIRVTVDPDTRQWKARSKQYQTGLQRAIEGVFDSFTADMTGDMQSQRHSHQHWQDHSGHARQGLQAVTRVNQDSKVGDPELVLSGKVPGEGAVQYNIFLEKSHDGRFATIIPTYEHYEPEIVKAIEGLVK